MGRKYRFVSVLTAAVLMTACCMPITFAAGSGVRNTTETALLTAVGIYDADAAENAESEREVTREEAVYYALLLTGANKNEFMSMYEPIFEDVSQTSKYAGAITMAYHLHIISKDLRFHPNEKVTVNEMTKMLAAVLGYDAYARLNGGYPSGYVMIANGLGLFRGIAGTGGAALTFRELTVMLNNALHADYMEQVSAGYTNTFQAKKGESILNRVFHIYHGKGQITGNAVSSVNSKSGVGEGRIEVGGYVCDVTNKILYAQLMQYLGYEGTYYIHEENGEKDLLFFKVDQSDVTTIFSEDFVGFENGVLQYYDNHGNLKSQKMPADAAVIYNGKAVTESFDSALFESDWGEVRVIQNTGAPDVVSIIAYENYVVSAIDRENYVVYDDTISGRKLDFKENGALSEHAYFRSKTGETLKFDKITENAVLSAAVSLDHDYFDVIVVTQTVSGTLKSMQKETINGVMRVKSVVVDENEFELAVNIYQSDRLEQLQLGGRYTFALDVGGRIAHFTAERNVAGGYVFLIDAKQSTDGLSRDIQFRIIDGNGDVLILESAKNIKIDGIRYKGETAGERILAALSVDGTEQGAIRSQTVAIAVNDSSQVTSIDTVRFTAAEDKNNSLYSLYDSEAEVAYKSSVKMFESYFGIDSSTKVFFYPKDTKDSKTKGADADYSLGSVNSFKNDAKYKLRAIAHAAESPLAVALEIEGSDNQSIGSQDYIMVVSNVCTGIDKEGEIKTVLNGYYQGAAVQFYAETDAVLLIDADTGKQAGTADARVVAVAEGDSIRFGRNAKKEVNEIELIYDYSEKHSYTNNDDMEQNILYQVICAPLYQKKSGFITLCKNAEESPAAETNPKRHFSANGYKVYVVEPVGRNGVNVRLGNTNDLKDYYTYHDDCSVVLLQMRYYDARTMVIYQK